MLWRRQSAVERKINRLRAEAARWYRIHASLCANLNCGAGLAADMFVSVSEAKRAYEAAMAQLGKLDPNCPKDYKLP